MLVTLLVVVMLVIMLWQISASYFRYSRLILSLFPTMVEEG